MDWTRKVNPVSGKTSGLYNYAKPRNGTLEWGKWPSSVCWLNVVTPLGTCSQFFVREWPASHKRLKSFAEIPSDLNFVAMYLMELNVPNYILSRFPKQSRKSPSVLKYQIFKVECDMDFCCGTETIEGHSSLNYDLRKLGQGPCSLLFPPEGCIPLSLSRSDGKLGSLWAWDIDLLSAGLSDAYGFLSFSLARAPDQYDEIIGHGPFDPFDCWPLGSNDPGQVFLHASVCQIVRMHRAGDLPQIADSPATIQDRISSLERNLAPDIKRIGCGKMTFGEIICLK